MSVKIKNIVIGVMLTLTTVPFLLLTDLFPFMRFGMFAEPVKYDRQLEVFQVTSIDTDGKETILDPKTIGIEPHFFHYISRNYFYRNEAGLFLNNISEISSNRSIKEWRLNKIITPLSKEEKADTLLVHRKVL